eukprot:NODE_8968_length_671_cov_6.728102_g8706_i0.p1 GENE.NODE_8968_length_671_cov_6.728102_g8706_i0~~NODE_8968_length_671_cov_6.728102_g8706_i0.p1  ORF type:complete len:167 (-),score=24.52 NODE_8968_length_671_cov_6.728102_g8706_i0:169-636(-)
MLRMLRTQPRPVRQLGSHRFYRTEDGYRLYMEMRFDWSTTVRFRDIPMGLRARYLVHKWTKMSSEKKKVWVERARIAREKEEAASSLRILNFMEEQLEQAPELPALHQRVEWVVARWMELSPEQREQYASESRTVGSDNAPASDDDVPKLDQKNF